MNWFRLTLAEEAVASLLDDPTAQASAVRLLNEMWDAGLLPRGTVPQRLYLRPKSTLACQDRLWFTHHLPVAGAEGVGLLVSEWNEATEEWEDGMCRVDSLTALGLCLTDEDRRPRTPNPDTLGPRANRATLEHLLSVALTL